MRIRQYITLCFVLSGIVAQAEDSIRYKGVIRVQKDFNSPLRPEFRRNWNLGGLWSIGNTNISPLLRTDIWLEKVQTSAETFRRPLVLVVAFEGYRRSAGLRSGFGVMYAMHQPSMGLNVLGSYPLIFFSGNDAVRNACRISAESAYVINQVTRQILFKPGLDFRLPLNSGTHMRAGISYVKVYKNKGDGSDGLPEGIQVSFALVLGRSMTD